jgi:hypothetical protein
VYRVSSPIVHHSVAIQDNPFRSMKPVDGMPCYRSKLLPKMRCNNVQVKPSCPTYVIVRPNNTNNTAHHRLNTCRSGYNWTCIEVEHATEQTSGENVQASSSSSSSSSLLTSANCCATRAAAEALALRGRRAGFLGLLLKVSSIFRRLYSFAICRRDFFGGDG